MATPELSARQLEALEPWSLLVLGRELGKQKPLRRGHEPLVRVHAATASRNDTNQPQVVIQRVLNELVKNAIEACDSAANPAVVDVTIEVRAEHAWVSVKDNGPGLSERVRRNLFEAYFSTKDAGRGLGLYLARAHLRQLGGELSLGSHTVGGTCFIMTFPLEAPLLASPRVAAE